MNDSADEEKETTGKLFMPSIVASAFLTMTPSLLTGMLLIDIGETFGTPVGVTGQIRTVAFIVSVVFALLMGVISVRYGHRSILLAGLILYGVSALGCSLAPSYALMLLLYSLSGVAYSMVQPMTTTLIGEHVPEERRPRAVGVVYAGMALPFLIGSPVIGYLHGIGGWRLTLYGFLLPVSALALGTAVRGIPPSSTNPGKGAGLSSYLSGFREVLSRGSAVACLACTVFLSASWQSLLTYNSSFLRERFLVTPGFVSYVMMGTGGFFIAGSMLTGRLVDKFGLKRLAVASTLATGLLLAPYMYMADLWVAVILSFTMCLLGGVAFASTGSLILEQVPRYRGSMMSINTAADNFGSALGAGLGGLLLLVFNYEKMGMALGSLALLSAITYQLLVRDPTRRAWPEIERQARD